MFHFLSEIVSPVYYTILIAAATYFFLLSLANHYEMWRFTSATSVFNGPLVSILVPARNEEQNIERCLKSLQNQLYKNYEIIVLNDNSTDKTLEIVSRIVADDSRVKVINGEPLPDD